MTPFGTPLVHHGNKGNERRRLDESGDIVNSVNTDTSDHEDLNAELEALDEDDEDFFTLPNIFSTIKRVLY